MKEFLEDVMKCEEVDLHVIRGITVFVDDFDLLAPKQWLDASLMDVAMKSLLDIKADIIIFVTQFMEE